MYWLWLYLTIIISFNSLKWPYLILSYHNNISLLIYEWIRANKLHNFNKCVSIKLSVQWKIPQHGSILLSINSKPTLRIFKRNPLFGTTHESKHSTLYWSSSCPVFSLLCCIKYNSSSGATNVGSKIIIIITLWMECSLSGCCWVEKK